MLNSVQELYQFRARIPANLSKDKVEDVWGINVSNDELPSLIEPRKNIIEEKIEIVRESLEWIVIKPFVKFIGVSGSIASEFAKESDDIDLFIVTKNDTVWIYRLYIYIKDLFRSRIRSKGNPEVKNKLCINFLAEQRALHFEEDIFNLNELLFLKPVYNKSFLNILFLNNPWLRENYMVSEKFLGQKDLKVREVKEITKRNYLLLPINFIAFVGQLIFMIVMGHEPDLKRLLNGFRKGRVQFYPKGFKNEKIRGVKID